MVGNQTGCLAGQYSDRFIDVPAEGDVVIPTICYRARYLVKILRQLILHLIGYE